ncbi:MAG: hypothetical protein AAF456_03180 [Planctomycetota bacterium]
MTSLLQKLLFALFLPLIAVLVILLIPVLLVVALVSRTRDRMWMRRFRRENDGRKFFIWSRRRGWASLIENNVLPVLESDIEPILIDKSRGNDLVRALWLSGKTAARPYFVIVCENEIRTMSVNECLTRFRTRGAVDQSVQEEVREILAAEIADLVVFNSEQPDS